MKKFIKEKLKNKFILSIITIIILIISFQAYKAITIMHTDTNTYIVYVKWKIKINSYLLKKNERKKLKVWDIIITKKDSACVIEWWDWSLTRLWENWKIEIQELNVKKDLSQINLQFKLVNWKTWSNVISFLWEKSYFKQNFKDNNSQDIEAAVRWTIFDVNLKRDYIYVANHEVSVKKEKETKIISQNQAFSISKFSFINMKKFIKKIQDKAWEEMNKKYDKKFFKNLKDNISKKIDIKNIDEILKNNTSYKDLLSEYQKLNFASAWDWKLFEAKNKIRQYLINKANDENKKQLVKYSYFDLQDAIKKQTWKKYEQLLKIVEDNKNLIPDINTDDINKKINSLKNWLWDLKNKADKYRDQFLNKILK